MDLYTVETTLTDDSYLPEDFLSLLNESKNLQNSFKLCKKVVDIMINILIMWIEEDKSCILPSKFKVSGDWIQENDYVKRIVDVNNGDWKAEFKVKKV